MVEPTAGIAVGNAGQRLDDGLLKSLPAPRLGRAQGWS
jgi:hypothetical protein